MRQLGLGLLLAAMLVSGQAFATFMTGNKLMEHCRQGENDTIKGAISLGLCVGYAVSIADVMEGQDVWDVRACLPEGVQQGQILDIVSQYLERQPAERHFPAPLLVAEALQDAFPCE